MFLRYALVADAVIDGERGKKSLLGVFNVIFAKKFPSVHPRLTLVIRLEGSLTEEGKHALQVELVDDDFNRIFTPPELEIEMQSKGRPVETAPLATEVSIEIMNVPFPKAGNYEFVVRVDGRHIGAVPISVRKVKYAKS